MSEDSEDMAESGSSKPVDTNDATAGLDPELLEILACPETKEPVAPASPEQLAALNRRIQSGGVINIGGSPVTDALQYALLREDGKRVYPVRDGIPILLIDEAIEP